MPDPLEHSGLLGEEDRGRGLVSLEPLEHSVLGAPLDQRDVSSSDGDLRVDSLSACCPSVISDDRGVDVAPLDGRPEATRIPPEAGNAIVVGAVGSAAPWFLTGWAHEVEVEFMIDIGFQVTILATTIFERMCTVDPMVRSSLRPCRRRLVSADSSPLTVKGELELNVVFPGLCCEYWFGWPAGYGSPAVVPATSVESQYGTVVGGRPINTTIASTETDPRGRWIFDDFGGAAAGQCNCGALFVVGGSAELLCLSGTFSDFDGGIRSDCRSHVSGCCFTDSQCIDGQPQRGGGGVAQFYLRG